MKKIGLVIAFLLASYLGHSQVYRISTLESTFIMQDTSQTVKETFPKRFVFGDVNRKGNIDVTKKGVGTSNIPFPYSRIGGIPYTSFLDGNDSDATFADAEDVETWFQNNCFNSAGGSASSTAFSTITGNPTDNSNLSDALDEKASKTVINVKDYGAVGNGTTDDLAAFNAATAAATAIGTKLFIPDGYYRITGTWNIGLVAYTEFDFMVDRVAPTLDADFNTYDIPANELINRDDYEAIDIEFSKGAFIVADWEPLSPEPVVSYNLETDRDKGGRATIQNPQIISSDVFSGGVHAPISISEPVTNNLIGLFYASKVIKVDNVLVSGCGYGIVAENPYWNTLTNIKVDWAKECVNILQGNAFNGYNWSLWNSVDGVIFNGSTSRITSVHTEQVTNEFWAMGGDANYFGQMYLEDVGSSDATGIYAFKTGTTEDGNQIPHCIYENIRVNGTRPNKGAFRIWAAGKSTFTGNRASGKSNLFDTYSNGNSVNNDFTLPTTFKTISVQKTGTTASNQVTTWDADGIVTGTNLLKYDEVSLVIGGDASVTNNGVATPTRNTAQHYIKTNAPRTTGYYQGMIGAGESDTSVNAGMFSFDSGGSAAVGLSFWAGDNSGINEKLKIPASGSITSSVSISLPSVISTSAAPATATSTGTTGEIRFDGSYIYRCTATNTWVRTAVTYSTW